MTRNLAALAMVVAMGSTAWAQDIKFQDPELNFREAGPVEWAPKAPVPEIGLRAGYVKPRDADDGTWFGGVQVRVPLAPMFAVEGSIEFHTEEFSDGDIEVVQYPVQATLLFFPMPDAPTVKPYLLAGLGWYYTTTDFSGSLSGVDSDTSSMFGAHLGFGAQFALGGSMTASADLRYIFLEPNDDALEDEDFDTIQLVLSLSFPF